MLGRVDCITGKGQGQEVTGSRDRSRRDPGPTPVIQYRSDDKEVTFG